MPQITAYATGTPCWVDVATSDLDAGVEFYTGLFGWEAHRAPEPEAGGYTMFRQDGLDVAAATPAEPGRPPAWSTYIATTDAEATAAAIHEAGGTLLVEPFDVFTAGRMAVAQDPTGALFSLWQAGDMPGAGLVNQPVSLCWDELITTDLDRATEFYSAVFAWEPEDMSAGAEDEPYTYRMMKLGEKSVAGAMPRLPEMGDAPSQWSVYFAVQDADAMIERARSLGGSLVAGPMDTPYGRFAVLGDPQRAVFAVIALAAPDA